MSWAFFVPTLRIGFLRVWQTNGGRTLRQLQRYAAVKRTACSKVLRGGMGNFQNATEVQQMLLSEVLDVPTWSKRLSAMPVFDFKFTVQAPLAAVQKFHHDTSALKRLTPPPTIIRLHEIEPLAEGSVSRFTLWVGPLPLRWTAVHRNVSENGFTDIQSEGPARKWEHTHTFTPVGDEATRIHEHIEYEHQSGFWGLVTRVLFARPNLYLMFTYRKLVTRWHLRRRAENVRDDHV